MPTTNVDILVNAKNNAGATLNQVKQQVSGIDKAAGMMMGGVAGIAATAGVGAIMQLGDAIGGMVAQAAQVDKVGNAFTGLAESAGQSSQSMLQSLRSASYGMVSDVDLMLAANKAMMLGVADTAEEMSSLLAIAQSRGAAMGLSVSQAFSDIITGLGRESALILDNLGIVIDSQGAMNDYAKSLGKTADALSSVERKQALVNAVMAQSAGMKASAPSGAGAAVAQAQVAQENSAVEVGRFFAPAVRDFAQGQVDIIRLIRGEWNSLDVAIRETSDLIADVPMPESMLRGLQEYVSVAQQARQAQEAGVEGAGLWVRMLDDMGARAMNANLTPIDANKIEFVANALQKVRDAALAQAQAQDEATAAAQRSVPYYYQIVQRTEEMADAAFRASPEMQKLATGLGIVGQIALASASDINQFNNAVARIGAGFGAAGNITAIKNAAIASAKGNAQRAVDEGADPAKIAAELDQVTNKIWDMGYTGTQTTENMFLFEQSLGAVGDGLETTADGLQKTNAAAERLATQGISNATAAFGDLKSKVESVLAGSTDLSFMGDTSDMFPREDAVNENARRLGAIAREGLIGQDWLEEFKAEVPDIYAALVESGDPKAEAAKLLKEFQRGMVPELIDKERAKDLVKQMIVGDANAAALAQEIAEELVAEGIGTAQGNLASAREALGLKGDATAGDSVSAGAAAGVNGGAVAQKLASDLKKQDNIDLLYAAGKSSGSTWASGFMATVGENIPKPLIDVLTSLVTPGVWASIQSLQTQTGATS